MPALRSPSPAAPPVEGLRSVALPGAADRPFRVYLPTDYQPKYAYPLVALLHGAGDSADAAARLVPLLSARNYVVVCPRGDARLAPRADGVPAFGWGPRAGRAVAEALAHAAAAYSVHAGRVFLVGCGAGAEVAVRFALARPGRVAGVAALGAVPAGRAPRTELAVLAGPGCDPAGVRHLRRAGATVTRAAGPAPADLLRAANRWIMARVAGAK